MKPKNEIQKELQDLGLSNLANSPKEPGFKVPDGYFDDLANSILEQLPVDSVEEKAPKVVFFNFRMVAAIAASLLVLVIFALSFLFIKDSKENGAFSLMSDYEYEEYFASLDDFSRLLVKEHLLELDGDYFDSDFEYFEEDEVLLDYLLDEANYHKFDPFFVIDLENK